MRTKWQSISFRVGGSLLVMVVAPVFVVLISIYGFWSIKQQVDDFSQTSIPEVISISGIGNQMGELWRQIERLSNAETQPQRRIYFDALSEQLDQLEDVFTSISNPQIKDHLGKQLNILISLQSELNQIVDERIAATQKSNDLFGQSHNLFRQSLKISANAQTRENEKSTHNLISQWGVAYSDIIYQVSIVYTAKRMYEITSSERVIRQRVGALSEATAKLPPAIRGDFEKLHQDTQEMVLGDEGLMSLLKLARMLESKSIGKRNFAVSMAKDLEAFSTQIFLDLNSSAKRQSEAISEDVRTRSEILVILILVTILFAGSMFYLFNRYFTSRLIKLNEEITERIEGRNIDVTETGDDEISDIAASVNYFANELIRAMLIMEETSNAKSEFLASMSHELRTPLNAVLGFAQMLQINPNQPLTEQQNNYVNNIISGGTHLLELVNDILDLAKIEADQLTLDYEEIAVGGVVAESIELAQPLGLDRGIQIHNHIQMDQNVLIRTDLVRFKQCLLNLLSNAVKYNRDGGTVTISGHSTDNGYFRILVTDTGIGIAQKEHASLFQKFHRINPNPMIAKEGTGIGLSVTKLLVERMAGHVGFDSQEGVGSTFWLELPLASNDNIMIWTETHRVGVDALDKDHQHIIQLMNKVLYYPSDHADVGRTLDALTDYLRYHFIREEAIMEACDFTDIDRHRAAHQDYINRLISCTQQWRAHPVSNNLQALRELMREWSVVHIMRQDQEIFKFTDGKEDRIRAALDALD